MKLQLYNPSSFQKKIHNSCNNKKGSFFLTVCTGRQAGKSIMAQNQAIFWALNKGKTKVMWISPSSSQYQKSYKEMLKALDGSGAIISNKGSMSDTEIIFSNGSSILFRSGAQKDSLRGFSNDYLIIDECAFIPEEVIIEILLPTLNVRGKKCLMLSTPKGKNVFWKYYMLGLSDDENYESFHFTSADNPLSNPDIIASARLNMPEALFAQEYLGEFIDSTAIFDNIDELATFNMIDEPKIADRYWIGVDIALRNDFSVVSIINQRSEVVKYYRWRMISAPKLKENLVEVFKLWNPEKIYIESNNQGLPIIQDLVITHKVQNIEGFNTSSISKPMIIHNLISAFSSKKITIPNDKIYKDELECFTMTMNSNGNAKFEAPPGKNDDCVMSLCIAWDCMNQNMFSGSYVWM